jgi:hypothetical protein
MRVMRRRPLLRAAAIGGGAYYAGKQRQRRRQSNAVPPAAMPAVDSVTQLERLGRLRDRGLLTDEEFAAQKAKLLGDTVG